MPDVDLLNQPWRTRAPHSIAGWRDAQPVTHAAFMAEIAAWQQLLRQHQGNRFALYCDDSINFAAILFAAWMSGKTIYLPGDALPATCQALQPLVDGFIGQFEASCAPLQLPAGDNAPAPDGLLNAPPLPADFPGLVVFTSGSTGTAQAIPKKLSQMASEVATLEALFGARAGYADIVATVSHQHIYGLLFKVLWPMTAGRAIHVRSAVFPQELAPLLNSRDCLLISSPAHLKRFPESPFVPDTSRLRAIFSSGGPLPAETALACAGWFGQAPIEIYGSSETGGIAWRQRDPAVRDQVANDSWQTMPQVSIRLTADETTEDADDHPDSDDNGLHQTLAVSSPHLPDAQWLRLADRARLLAPGRFVLLGRADRIVKLEEKRVSLDAIERLLQTSPLVAEARTLLHDAGAQQYRRQRIAACVVLSAAGKHLLAAQGKLAVNQQLRTLLADTVEAIALPRSWRYIDALPLNAQGKVTRAALLALLEPAHRARPQWPQAQLQEQDAQRVVLALTIPADLLYFDGHFPGAPILPGVVQTDWAISYGRRYFDLPPHFAGMQALKFQQVILPGASVTLELQHDTQKSVLNFRIHSEAGAHASGRILFGA